MPPTVSRHAGHLAPPPSPPARSGASREHRVVTNSERHTILLARGQCGARAWGRGAVRDPTHDVTALRSYSRAAGGGVSVAVSGSVIGNARQFM